MLLGLVLEQVDRPPFLFLKEKLLYQEKIGTYADPGVLLHEVHHLVAHGDSLLLHVPAIYPSALIVGVTYHGLYLLLVQGVNHGPEILFVALPALVDLGRHIERDVSTVSELAVEALDADLRVVPDIDRLDLHPFQQSLLPAQYHPDPLLREVALRRYI